MRLTTRLLVPVLGLALLAGCKKASDDDGGSGPGPSPTGGHYTALGASDAIGVGGSVPCLPFTDCPGGTGYVPRILRSLREQDAATRLTNIGLPGAVMSREVQDIGNGVGIGINNNFLQHEAPFVPPTTTLVTIFAGANDANTLATAIDRGAAGSVDANTYIDGQVAAFAEDYRELVAIVRGRAPAARIYVLNLPNFAGVPFAVGRSTRDRQWLQRLSVGFSVQGANALVGLNVTVVDLLCNPRSYQSATYSSDGFHPGDAGYAYLADELIKAIAAGSYPPPAASCAQMTIVPR
ncbi:MAG: SGNH/GDSL hydrolase family protein [Vicinamibacteria bacterium]|nr:SGNH/GDSL hydrolase family protein [Vicinamibacteria bacterium]